MLIFQANVLFINVGMNFRGFLSLVRDHPSSGDLSIMRLRITEVQQEEDGVFNVFIGFMYFFPERSENFT
jgi:hypothetical protein